MAKPSERGLRVDAIYRASLARSPGERLAYLSEACAGDEALRCEVELRLTRRSSGDTLWDAGAIGEPGVSMSEAATASTLSGTLAPPSSPALESWGPFKILQKIGQGSFGEVFLAFDTTLEREVALKLLMPSEADGDRDRQAMLREARAMARVRHPNVVSVYGVDRHQGRVGFWSDFVRGQTLSALLAAQGPFGPREVAHIGVDLCRAVSAVHAARLLHRDIKTGNVMREEGGRILLMDFGLTHADGEFQGVAGTPAYMAPELFQGHPASVSSDLYALGVLLFHLLTGKHPVEGSDLGIRQAHERGARHALLDVRPDLPEPFARVVDTATHPEPTKRWPSAGQMAAILSETVVTALVTPQPQRVDRSHGSSSASFALVREDYRKAHDLLEHYYKPNALETAIPLLRDVVEQDATYAPAWADLGRANFLQFWQLRDNSYVEPSRSASFQALALNSDLACVHVTLGALYTETGQHDLATQELSDALRLDSRHAEAYSALAELLYRQGRTMQVEPTFRKSIDLDPGSWSLFNQFGYYYLRSGKFDLAAVQFSSAVALTPDNPRALNNLGICYWRLNRLKDSHDMFTRAIQLEPSSGRYVNLGRVLAEQQQYSEAIEIFQQAIRMSPANFAAWGELGTASQRSNGDASQTRAAFETAVGLGEEQRKMRPKDPLLLADLAMNYAQLGDEAHSVPLANQAVALAPENASVLQQVATAFELLHRREDALALLQQALALGRSRTLIEQEPDLSDLRCDVRYQAMIQIISPVSDDTNNS